METLKKWLVVFLLTLTLMACENSKELNEGVDEQIFDVNQDAKENVAVSADAKEPTGFVFEGTEEFHNDELETLLIQEKEFGTSMKITLLDENTPLLEFSSQTYALFNEGSWTFMKTYSDSAGELKGYELANGILFKKEETSGFSFYDPLTKKMIPTDYNSSFGPTIINTTMGYAHVFNNENTYTISALNEETNASFRDPKNVLDGIGSGDFYDFNSKQLTLFGSYDTSIKAYNTDQEDYVYDSSGEVAGYKEPYEYYNSTQGTENTTYSLIRSSKDNVVLVSFNDQMEVVAEVSISEHLMNQDSLNTVGGLTLSQNEDGSKVYVYEGYKRKSVAAISKHTFTYSEDN